MVLYKCNPNTCVGEARESSTSSRSKSEVSLGYLGETFLKSITGQAVVVHAFNPSTLGSRGRWISEFEASLVYNVSSRTARATQRNSVSRKKRA